METALILLAAGKGTRMNSDLPKVLHKIAGDPMLIHALEAGKVLQPARTIVVAGHEAEQVRATVQGHNGEIDVVVQDAQRGTAHAVAQAHQALHDFDGTAFVLYGDTPFIKPETLLKMRDTLASSDVVVLGFDAIDPARYGRLVIADGQLERIVEFKDASDEERSISICNSGVIASRSNLLFDLIDAVNPRNAAEEFYLTDIVQIARERGLSALAVLCDETETLGINTRADLVAAEAAFQSRARAALIDHGVTLIAPETVFLSRDTKIGRDAIIEPNVVFGPGVRIEAGATIRSFSHLEGCHVAAGSIVGPYARLRPGATLAENVRIGNFVEVKNTRIGQAAKVNHLSYLGDANVGENANIGAGTITCNYDGVQKHRTHIGANAFIGSNTMLVAPVTIGDGALTGSGSVITVDVSSDALAIARAPQVEKPGLARKMFELFKSRSHKGQKES
ncbi:MAG: bifunctional UDP-N-acetylglucosamine diphosphorylase/glucosamine-1-phosphate N-acetyltransferase GlmU [Pseudomonadota bacterium]